MNYIAKFAVAEEKRLVFENRPAAYIEVREERNAQKISRLYQPQ